MLQMQVVAMKIQFWSLSDGILISEMVTDLTHGILMIGIILKG